MAERWLYAHSQYMSRRCKNSLFYRLPLTITSSSIYKINNIYANPSHLYSTPQKMSRVPTECFIVRHFLTIKKKFNFLFESIGVIKNKHFTIYWFWVTRLCKGAASWRIVMEETSTEHCKILFPVKCWIPHQ